MFSYGIFKSNIKRFWIVPAVATIILFLVTTFQMILRTNDIKERRTDYINDIVMLDEKKADENIIVINNNIASEITNNTTSNVTNTVQVVDEDSIEPYYSPNNYDREHYIEILYNPIVLLTIFVLPVLVSILLFKYTNEE